MNRELYNRLTKVEAIYTEIEKLQKQKQNFSANINNLKSSLHPKYVKLHSEDNEATLSKELERKHK